MRATPPLARLIDEATSTHERFEITRNGRRAAVLLSADDHDTLQDTPLCTVDDDHRLVEVTTIRHRADAYRG